MRATLIIEPEDNVVTINNILALQEDHFGRWKNREAITENLLPIIGRIYRERTICNRQYDSAESEPFGTGSVLALLFALIRDDIVQYANG